MKNRFIKIIALVGGFVVSLLGLYSLQRDTFKTITAAVGGLAALL